MSQENYLKINTALIVFSLTSLVTVAVAWGAMASGQNQLKDGQRQMQEILQRLEADGRDVHGRVITHEEKIYGLERRVSAVERKTGLAGQNAGEPNFVDGGKQK